jgi:hypothetical protein
MNFPTFFGLTFPSENLMFRDFSIISFWSKIFKEIYLFSSFFKKLKYWKILGSIFQHLKQQLISHKNSFEKYLHSLFDKSHPKYFPKKKPETKNQKAITTHLRIQKRITKQG